MSENYKFEPNYAAWWEKEDLTKEQLIWLMLGINPDDMTKLRELEGKLNPSENEKDWKWAFDGIDGYLEKLPDGFFLSKNFKDYNQLIDWKDDKKQFITDTYEFHLKINDTFLKYLEDIDAFTRNKELENFKDFQKYQYDFSELSKNIETEDNAFSILLGLKPKFFIYFHELDTKIKNTPRDERDYVEYINFSSTDKWFYSEYNKFLELSYGETSKYRIFNTLKKAKEMNLWDGNFLNYCQKLYDEGFIFKNDIYAAFEKSNVKFAYSHDSWAVQFYKYWHKKGGWTLLEAMRLFTGQNPKDNERGFHDFSQNLFLLYASPPHMWAYDLFTEKYEELDKILLRHTAVERIREYKAKDESIYKAKEIIEWLMKNTLHIPPKALLQVLEIQESKEEEIQRVEDNLKASEIQSSSRQNELHACIGNALQKLKQTDIKPSANEVWKYIEKNKEQYMCIQSFEMSQKTKEIAIQWISKNGIEQEMSRGSFNNVVSAYNTGKKPFTQ